MARARNIKPGLYKNEDLAECSIWARFVFPGLWMLADRDGRMEDRPKRIKAELLPFDDANVDQLLNELARFGFILRYEVEGERYIQVLKFSEHQTPHVREQAGTIPAPVIPVQGTAKVVHDHSLDDGVSSPRSPDSLIPSSLIPDSLIPHPVVEATASPKPRIVKTRAADWEDEFDSMWALYPRKPGMSKAATLKAFGARVGEGASIPAMLAGVQGYASYVVANHTEPKYIKAPETFFGPGKHWESDWSPPPRGAGRTANAQQTIDNLQAYLNEHEN